MVQFNIPKAAVWTTDTSALLKYQETEDVKKEIPSDVVVYVDGNLDESKDDDMVKDEVSMSGETIDKEDDQKVPDETETDEKTCTFRKGCCMAFYTFGMIVFSTCHIVWGVFNIGNCEREPVLPILYIIAGCLYLIMVPVCCMKKMMEGKKYKGQKKEDEKNLAKFINPVHNLLLYIFFGWLVAGSILVFRIFDDYQSEDPDKPKYCQRNLYQGTFAMLRFFWGFAALVFILWLVNIFVTKLIRNEAEE